MPIIINGSEIKGIVYNGVVCPGYLNGQLITPSETPQEKLIIDGKEYRTVKIGNQTWMAENLESDAFGGVWYNNDENTYKPLGYGKLYSYDEATQISNSVSGWHLPTKNEFGTLINYFGNESIAAIKLKTTTGWNTNNGTDDFHFSVLPAGMVIYDGSFAFAGEMGTFWTSTEYWPEDFDNMVYRFYIDDYNNCMNTGVDYPLPNRLNIRLIKDT